MNWFKLKNKKKENLTREEFEKSIETIQLNKEESEEYEKCMKNISNGVKFLN